MFRSARQRAQPQEAPTRGRPPTRATRSTRRRWIDRACAACVWASSSAAWLGCTEEVRLGRVLTAGAESSSPAGAAGAPGTSGAPSVAGQPSFLPIGGAGSSLDAGDAPPRDAGPCVPVACGATYRQCGNCRDDDGDGAIDARDPECLGPCDDSEAELGTGTASRVTGSCRTDCYFDRNSGSGNDGCAWSYRCDPLSVAPSFFPTGSSMCGFDPNDSSCDQSPGALSECDASCLPLTPNGCDCFGCCELPAGSNHFIWLGAASDQTQCELATLADPAACSPCTPVPSCQNPCEDCELCVGKPSLPASCAPGAGPECPVGTSSCDPNASGGCGPFEYCITGCCIPLPA
jgi:hypothetical protein